MEHRIVWRVRECFSRFGRLCRPAAWIIHDDIVNGDTQLHETVIPTSATRRNLPRCGSRVPCCRHYISGSPITLRMKYMGGFRALDLFSSGSLKPASSTAELGTYNKATHFPQSKRCYGHAKLWWPTQVECQQSRTHRRQRGRFLGPTRALKKARELHGPSE
jgi:hypothetical protein